MAQDDKNKKQVDQAKNQGDAKQKADAAKKHSQIDESGADLSKNKKK